MMILTTKRKRIFLATKDGSFYCWGKEIYKGGKPTGLDDVAQRGALMQIAYKFYQMGRAGR